MILKNLSFEPLWLAPFFLGTYTQLSLDAENTGSSAYSPRATQSEIERDALGASEITRMLAGDIETGEINAQGLAELRKELRSLLTLKATEVRNQLISLGLKWALTTLVVVQELWLSTQITRVFFAEVFRRTLEVRRRSKYLGSGDQLP